MARNLFHDFSPSKLSEAIQKVVAEDNRTLPTRSKVFAAVARMQEFDVWPDLKPDAEVDEDIKVGATELNRGMWASNGIPAILYAKDLVRGPLFPGTQAALGAGIYFTDLGCPRPDLPPMKGFPRIAKTACEHAELGETGIVMRCALSREAKLMPHDELKQYYRENRNRCLEAQLTDCGSLIAALGFDGSVCDDVSHNHGERWFVIVNRRVLKFQMTLVKCKRTEPNNPPQEHEKAATRPNQSSHQHRGL